jgi:hypothetical protein
MWRTIYPEKKPKRFRLRLDATFEATDMDEAITLVHKRIMPEADHPRILGQKVDKPFFFIEDMSIGPLDDVHPDDHGAAPDAPDS